MALADIYWPVRGGGHEASTGFLSSLAVLLALEQCVSIRDIAYHWAEPALLAPRAATAYLPSRHIHSQHSGGASDFVLPTLPWRKSVARKWPLLQDYGQRSESRTVAPAA